MRILIPAAIASLSACTLPQTPAPIGPVTLHSNRSASDIASIAAQQLTAAGFTLTQSDAAGGIVTAHSDKARDGNSAYVDCGGRNLSLMQTDLVVSVIARNGDVQITGIVHASYPGMAGTIVAGAMTPNDTDCVSNGVIEKRIADAIR